MDTKKFDNTKPNEKGTVENLIEKAIANIKKGNLNIGMNLLVKAVYQYPDDPRVTELKKRYEHTIHYQTALKFYSNP